MESSTDTESRLYNSRITDSYLKLLKKNYPHVSVSELLDYAGIKDYEVADPAHWFTHKQVVRFQEKIVQLTGNQNIAREAGRFACSVDALGIIRHYLVGFVGVSHFFEQWSTKAGASLTRSSVYTCRKISRNKVEITVTPVVEGVERPFQCENRTGFLEAVVLMYKKTPTNTHPECIFAGGKVCRYEITWTAGAVAFLRLACNILTLLLVALNVALACAAEWSMLERALTVSLAIELLLAVAAERGEKKELISRLDNAMELKDTFLDQINRNYNNVQMTNEIAQGLGNYTSTDDIYANLVKIMQKRLVYDRGLLFLANNAGTRLQLKTGYGFSIPQMLRLQKLSFHLNRRRPKLLLVRSFKEHRPFLVNNLQEAEGILSRRSLEFAKRIGTVSFICCPVICEDKAIGVLAVDNTSNKQPLVESDMSLLMGIASVVGISIRNSELSEGRVRVFKSIIQTLAASIDARDPLTAGHSEKVTEYAVAICRELGLPAEYAAVIGVAAQLHDYGKLGVPDTILKKKGSLSAEEYAKVKEHSWKTCEILSKIDFEGLYCEVPEIAGSHHEKLDGSGYPKGLKGEEIPLGGRIIAVADYFEAVTARRHYHEPISAPDAFALLRDEVARSHLEERLVDALETYYAKTYWGARESADVNDPLWPTIYADGEGMADEAPAAGV